MENTQTTNTILPTSAIHTVTSGIIESISSNIGVIIAVTAFIIGLSIVMALFDQAADNRRLDRYSRLWRK